MKKIIKLKYCEKCNFDPCHCAVIDWEGNIPNYPNVCKNCRAVDDMGYGYVSHNGIPIICDDMEACKVRTAKRKEIITVTNAYVKIELDKAKNELEKTLSEIESIKEIIKSKTNELNNIIVKVRCNKETIDDLINAAKLYKMISTYKDKAFNLESKTITINSEIKTIIDKYRH